MESTVINKEDLNHYFSKSSAKPATISIPFISSLKMEPVAIDVGYGAVKVFSMHGRFSFPSLIYRVRKDSKVGDSPTDIKYMDSDNDVWYIGDRARDSIEPDSHIIDKNNMYSTNRLETDEYLILFRVGIFLGCCDLENGFVGTNKKLKICTGLPEEFVESSSLLLRRRLSGHHHFKISIGGREWTSVSFDIKDEDIEILSQPYGTIFSVAYNHIGFPTKIDLLVKKNTLVLDGGMYTFDTFLNNAGAQGTSKTWEEYSMYYVHELLVDRIYQKVGRKINPYEVEKLIKDYKCIVRYENNQKYDFSDDFIEILKKRAEKLVNQLKITYRNFNSIDSVIITGGTGNAMYPFLKTMLPVDEIIITDENVINQPDFDVVFSNVIGFFNFLISCIRNDYNIDSTESDNEIIVKEFNSETES